MSFATPGSTRHGLVNPDMIAALTLALSILILSAVYAASFMYGPRWEVPVFRAASAAFFACVALGGGLLLRSMAAPGRDSPSFVWIAPAVVAITLLLSAYFLLPTSAALAFALAILAGTFAAVRLAPGEASERRATDVLLLLAWLLPVIVIMTTPMGNDMLPFIERVSLAFFRGEDPYYVDLSDISDNYFLYLPLQWLTYSPLAALGVDLRLLNPVLMALTLLLLRPVVQRSVYRTEAALILFVLMASYPVLLATTTAQMWVTWPLVTLLAILIARERLLAAAVVLGLALATRQTALLIAGPLALYYIRRVRLGTYVGFGIIAGGIWLGLLALFARNGLLDFMHLMYVERPRLSVAETVLIGNPINQISLAGFGTKELIERFATLAQLVGALGFGAFLLLKRNLPPSRMLIALGLFFLLEMGLGGFVHRYYYVTGFLFIGIGVAYLGREGRGGD